MPLMSTIRSITTFKNWSWRVQPKSSKTAISRIATHNPNPISQLISKTILAHYIWFVWSFRARAHHFFLKAWFFWDTFRLNSPNPSEISSQITEDIQERTEINIPHSVKGSKSQISSSFFWNHFFKKYDIAPLST